MGKTPFRIGAKDLAKMQMPNFCERCFWYYLHCKPLPFNTFPGIFNELDRLEKSIVQANIDAYGCPPSWMGDACAAATGYEEVGFLDWEDEDNAITLRGGPDVVLHNKNQSWWYVGDYKTARFQDGKDYFFPQYQGQLTGYAFLLTKHGCKKPAAAGLLYMAPKPNPTPKELLSYITKTGFRPDFDVEVVDIELGSFDLIHSWLSEARTIYDYEQPPEGREGCRNCKCIDIFIKQARPDPRAKDKYAYLGYTILGDHGKRIPARVLVQDEVLEHDDDKYVWLPDWAD